MSLVRRKASRVFIVTVLVGRAGRWARLLWQGRRSWYDDHLGYMLIARVDVLVVIPRWNDDCHRERQSRRSGHRIPSAFPWLWHPQSDVMNTSRFNLMAQRTCDVPLKFVSAPRNLNDTRHLYGLVGNHAVSLVI